MKKIVTVFSGIIYLLLFFSTSSYSSIRTEKTRSAAPIKIKECYKRPPLSFIENQGQVDRNVSCYVKGNQGAIYFTKNDIVYDLISRHSSPLLKETNPEAIRRFSFAIKPLDTNKDVRLFLRTELPGKLNYLTGKDPKKWHTGVSIYKEVIYKDLYKGIDLKIYGADLQMEYDFIVSPGADPSIIAMACIGVDALEVDKKGDLLIKTPLGEIRHLKPIIYQEIDGVRQITKGQFVVAENTFSFLVGNYNKAYPLIIDPVTLSYSTYLGGNSNDVANCIAIDTSGNSYVTGTEWSTDFPTANAYQDKKGGNYDVFVTKFNSAGNVLSYSTYLGGSKLDYGQSIAVDSSGNAYITGQTKSSDFPTKNAYQETYAGGENDGDAFVSVLNSAGNALAYSTYLGGTKGDFGYGIAVDTSANAYITGYTISTDFPTVNAYQQTHGGYQDAFATKINSTGSILYSTYLGGNSVDIGHSIAVNASGNAYVTGETSSDDFPTVNPYQVTRGGSYNAFVTKFNQNGDTLIYSTYIGGSISEGGEDIAVDASGNAFVTGYTFSTDFPTVNAYQGTYAGGENDGDAFVTKFNSAGNTLSYSTYLGGSKMDYGKSIAVDTSGNAYVTGETYSDDFPTKDAYQDVHGGGPSDVFISKFNFGDSESDYYVDGTNGDDILGNGTSALPWQTIKKGVASLQPGETLIVRDGIYSGEENNISGEYGGYDNMPSGSSGKYITIMAEHYLGAVIDGGNLYRPVFIWNTSYIIFKNFHFKNAGTDNGGANFRAQDCDHIKVLNCVSEESYFGHFWFYNSKYCLVEDCASWGRSAYSYVFVGEYDDYTRSRYNVVRRCLARRDVHYYPDHQANHFASFVAYWADHTYFQNCISIDGIHIEDENNVPDDDWIATTVFFTTNGASNYFVNGCIAVNDIGQIASCSPGDSEAITFMNNAVWMNNNSTFGILAIGQNANYTAINNTLANVRGTGDYQGSGIGRTEGVIQAIENNILVNNRIGLDRIPGNNSYNVLYNTNNYNETSPGTGEVVNIDPRTSGLSYVPRIEDSSALKTLGKSGTQAGAQIVKRIGVSESLYGESGWDTITNENLWPWPNEDILKSKISSYNLHGVNGKRGFCSAGNGLYGGPITLTSYIWEYLGNPCPIEFYGTTALPTVTTHNATSVNSSSATLNGTINPNDISTTYYFEYGTDMNYGTTTATGNAGSGTDDVQVSADITGLSDLTYYHFRVVATNTGGANYGSDQYFNTHNLAVPVVGQLAISNISSTGATTGVYIIDDGGASITECGIVYATSEGPTTADNKIVASECSGENISLTGLNPDTTYYVRAYAINSIGTYYSVETSFTTESASFSVSLVNPENDVTDVLVDTIITVTFSETMDASTITTESFSLTNGAVTVLGAVSCNNNTATFTPASNLDYNTIYTATVTADAKNLSGDPLQDDYIWSFTTGASTEVTLWTFGTNIEAADGDIEFYQTWNNAHSDFYVHDITYQSDGADVKGWVLQPKTTGPHPVLIWNRGGAGHWEEIAWHANDGSETLYKNELFLYAAAGYVVVCTQYRGNGRTVLLGHDDRFNPTSPPTASDFASGTDPFIEDNDNDYRGGIEINDVINLLPLIQKLSTTNGNNGLKININLSQIAMMGISRGGTETYIALRELSEKGKYGGLPSIKAAIIKGAGSHYPDWLKDVFEEKTIWHELYGSNTLSPRKAAAAISGNFDWTYPDDYDDTGDPGYVFWSFFPETGDFPLWNDNDLKNDEWPESGFSVHPNYPYYKIYSEEYYARSAILWDSFWSQNQIPLLILHSKGDTQVLWNDAQDIYNKIISIGNSSLYTLKLFDDSDDNCEACSFLRSAIGKKLYCDHWLIENNYGFDDVISWLTAQFANDSVANLTIDCCNASPAIPGQAHSVTIGIDTKGLTLLGLGVIFTFDPSQLTPTGASAISLAQGGTVQTTVISPENYLVQLSYTNGFKGAGDIIKIDTTIASNLCNLSEAPSTLQVGIAAGTCDIDLYCCSPDGDIAPLGSPDGQVNVGDALVGLRFALGLEPGHPTANELCHGDVAPLDTSNQPSPDGEITVGDALVILRKALGLISF